MIALEQGPPANRPDARRARFLFLVLVAAGLLGFALLPKGIPGKFGLAGGDMWFLDTYALLASSDAVQAGQDPSRPNPLDVYGRPHSYSSWWFLLGEIGLTRDDNTLLGGMVIGVFVLGIALYLRPSTRGEAIAGALAVLSPVVLLAFNRANNDLVVWAVLAAGLLLLRDTAPWRVALFGVVVTIATGLKFYPLFAGAALLVAGPVRRNGWAWALVTVGCAVVLSSQWDWLRRAVIPVPEGVYLFGAGVWWREWGLTGWAPSAVTLGLLVAGAGWLNRRGWCRGLAEEDGPMWVRAGFAAGAALLVGCWLAGISFAYRWIFALFLLPWLWQRARGGDRSARLVTPLLLACLWLDSLFCLATNVFNGPMPLERLRSLQHAWQLGLQPVVGFLMLACTAWLWDLLMTRMRELPRPQWRASPRWLWLLLMLGWMVYVQSDRLRQVVGLPNSETWFLDSYAVLAASDAHAAGLDAAAAGHYDPLGRPHRYSDWWHGLGSLGLTRDHNFVLGLAWVVAAVAALAGTVRPSSWKETGWTLLVLLSPGIFLGFNRANNDLVVFALLGLALVALRKDRAWRHALAASAVACAAGLKFYPVVAALPLAWFHLRGGRWKTAAASAAVTFAALAAVWSQMARGRFPVEVSVHVWGAAIWPRDVGAGTGLMVGLMALGLVAAWVLAARADQAPPTHPDQSWRELALLTGGTILLACFAAGLSYGYRWIFAVWLAPWLMASRWPVARLACWLVPLVLWLDGLLCLAVNTDGLVVAGRNHAQLQHGWRLLTQPVVWLLMVLIAAIMIAVGRQIWRRAPA